MLLSLACTRGTEPAAAAPPPVVPASPVCPEPSLFCDGFEDDAVGQAPGAPWRDETGSSGAQVSVDETRAFRGRRSVHVLAPKGAAYRRGYFAIHQAPVFPVAGSELYGRAMLWLDEAPQAVGANVHWTMVQGEGRSRDDTFNSLYRYGGQHQQGLGLMANYETTPPVRSDCWQHSQSRLPVQRWACVEWRFAVSGNEMQLWLDGSELTDLHVVERGQGEQSGCLGTEALGGRWLAPPAFQSLYLGWERYQETSNDQNLWVDDVVVSQSRIGCPAPEPVSAPR
jgi:hypothetical protein